MMSIINRSCLQFQDLISNYFYYGYDHTDTLHGFEASPVAAVNTRHQFHFHFFLISKVVYKETIQEIYEQ